MLRRDEGRLVHSLAARHHVDVQPERRQRPFHVGRGVGVLHGELLAARNENLKKLIATMLPRLTRMEVDFTKSGQVFDAQAVRAYRESLTKSKYHVRNLQSRFRREEMFVAKCS